ncbi:MAG: hypothetical protein D6711_18205 [Chloroflexi bacterium]|nr:MAG: hypothetical protein D6711_18205 [Chloroflexota bacterium]
MPIQTIWADDSQKLIWCKFDGSWDWEDFHSATKVVQSMVKSVPHTVNIMAFAITKTRLPGPIPFNEIEANVLDYPRNVGIVIMITDNVLIRRMFNLARKFYAVDEVFHLVNTMKAAEALLSEWRTYDDRKQSLIADMGRNIQVITHAAIEKLRAEDWLYDGSLRGAQLKSANLQEANLFLANLSGAYMHFANLRSANLFRAELVETDLSAANLSGASCVGANFERANLQKARLQYADLCGANLEKANLLDAQIDGTMFDEFTILPDGTGWTSQTNMSQFTRPKPELDLLPSNADDETEPLPVATKLPVPVVKPNTEQNQDTLSKPDKQQSTATLTAGSTQAESAISPKSVEASSASTTTNTEPIKPITNKIIPLPKPDDDTDEKTGTQDNK